MGIYSGRKIPRRADFGEDVSARMARSFVVHVSAWRFWRGGFGVEVSAWTFRRGGFGAEALKRFFGWKQ